MRFLLTIILTVFMFGCATQKRATVYTQNSLDISIKDDSIAVIVDKDFVRMIKVNAGDPGPNNPYCKRHLSKEKVYFVECKEKNTIPNFVEKKVEVIIFD